MIGNFVDSLLRKAGVEAMGPFYSRILSTQLPYGSRKNEEWPRVLGKRHLKIATLLSAGLVIYLLVSLKVNNAVPAPY